MSASREVLVIALMAACRGPQVDLGRFTLTWDERAATLAVDRDGTRLLDLERFEVGTGDATVDFQLGSYRFDDVQTDWSQAATMKVEAREKDAILLATLVDDSGEALGTLQAWPAGDDLLELQLDGTTGANRARVTFGCPSNAVFLGGGAQAFDVDHAGEAFPLWVSEPGIGKSDTDLYPDDWYVEGTRHSSSFPSPFFLQPDSGHGAPVGVGVETWARVDADLCSTDPSRWSLANWDRSLYLLVVAGDTPLDVVGRHALAAGRPMIPPDWAFAPWNDAIRGTDRVMQVASELREAGAPSSVIWTEDWKGGEDTTAGYALSDDWEVDTDLYPDPSRIAADLEAEGFKWLAYFSPFIAEDTPVDGSDPSAGLAADSYGILAPDGSGPYWFLGAGLQPVTVLDPSNPDAVAWAEEKMTAAVELGFDGWMADYGEWLPPDAGLDNLDPMTEHHAYPRAWHQLSAQVLSDALDGDGVYFTRSGWTGEQTVSPITWAGDQRTDFETDDGMPTVVPMGIGLGIVGVPFYAHDIAGYQSLGNDPSDKELWFRWCELGAFSPIMRTHHGRFDTENWQFDSDEETLALYARYGAEHARLYPYLRGLAARAESDGTPLVLAPALVYPDTDWGRTDAWLLGPALLVAPVMERGATGRNVDLPGGVDWYDWWTGQKVQSGWFDAATDEIPVFAAGGTIVPTLAWAPDTFTDATDPDVTTLADADAERTIHVFGTGGTFTEADGTTYTASGVASSPGSVTRTLISGTIDLNGLSLDIEGDTKRTYTVNVHP